MKKILALLITIIMIVSMSAVVFAANDYVDSPHINEEEVLEEIEATEPPIEPEETNSGSGIIFAIIVTAVVAGTVTLTVIKYKKRNNG